MIKTTTDEVPINTTDEMSIVGLGTLLLGDERHPIRVEAQSIDGLFPDHFEITGDSDVMHFAFHKRKVKIEMFGTQFQVRTLGYRKDIGALLVVAAPFLEGLHRCACN
jgi:hypothetical protein